MPKLERRSEMVYVGVDPGKSGGIAVIYPSGVVVEKMPPDEAALWACLSGMLKGQSAHVILEKVGGYIREGSDGVGGGAQPGSHAFKFGRNYGQLEAFLEVLRCTEDVTWERVIPETWQSGLGILPRIKGRRLAGREAAVKTEVEGAEDKPAFKRRLKMIAAKMFPDVKVTLATCDSLLIAQYCKKLKGRN